MSVWGKLFTGLRGAVNDAAENAADATAITTLRQEIRDAKDALRKARSDLAGIVATTKRLEKRVAESEAKESADVERARAAMTAGREDLARGLAERIGATRQERAKDETDLETFRARQASMTRAVQDTQSRIDAMEREIESVQATASLQRAQAAVASSRAGVDSRMGSAMDSLERIKRRQEEQAARLEAGDELAAIADGTDLDRQLAEAGIGRGGATEADDILAQIAGSSPSRPALEDRSRTT